MHTTSASLLERLRLPTDQAAWERFVQLYTPLLYYWARHLGLQPNDAADLVQDVLTALVQKLPGFVYDRHKSFRNWLRTLTLNRWRNNQRRRAVPVLNSAEVDLADQTSPDPVEAFAEAEYRQHLVGRILELMRAEFEPGTWMACWEHVVAGRSAADVAGELGISVGAVYVAKCRVLRRLRQELHGLLD
jgi:RNA polymerase sigma-70 factor (ECF subfamily)